jgi:2',3'-cyclic-nucleotide 2'-phosphodiesterase (5'-nucleotidase family)
MSSVGGVAARSSMISEVRITNAERGWGTLLFDVGDVFMKDPMSAVFFGEPDVLAMNMMGYDAMSLGNHEFTVNRPRLTSFRARASFPLIATNVLIKKDRTYLVEPHVSLKVGDVSVHVMATVTPDTVKLVKFENVDDLVFDDPVKAISRALPLLKHPGDRKNLVVVLVHDVLESSIAISRIPGVDLVLAGHEHAVIDTPPKGAGAPIFSSGKYGLNLGRVDLIIPDRGEVTLKCRMIPIGDFRVAEMVAGYEARFMRIMSENVGIARRPFSTGNRLEGETNFGNYLVDSYRSVLECDVFLLNGGVLGVVDIPAGSVTMEDVFAVIPYNNLLEVRKVRGDVIQEAIVWGLANRGTNPFVHYSGCRVILGAGGEPIVTVNGKPLDRTAEYTLGSTDFLFAGGDGYESLRRAANSAEVIRSRYMRDAAISWIKGTGEINCSLDGRVPSTVTSGSEGAGM